MNRWQIVRGQVPETLDNRGGEVASDELRRLIGQFLCRHELERVPSRYLPAIKALVSTQSLSGIVALLEAVPRLPVDPKTEPSEIFLLT